ncbi:MAG TPA: signal recognition particle-docking protein FtsY [Verrucomicrobia bacterium]|nr:signal recognition particle-docking protein FtsY [Verrucomicrobiales bacterium]HIL53782.1 signal recognition particle-docking protein FtsY [Verrucomicrobiota bacterium]
MAGLFKRILNKFSREKFDWDELEETLISGDLGVQLSMQIMDVLQEKRKSINPEDIIDACRSEIRSILPTDSIDITTSEEGPKVILVVGVNGTGKTTSSAKLAGLLKSKGHSVILAAADTFRAAAIEQLEIWATRIDVPLIKGEYKTDPSSVCFDAHSAAIDADADFLICDTAGRLHTRHNLMEELKKIKRTLSKMNENAPHEVLLVVDATTGSNALSQAKEFHATTDLTGLIVTKMDGSGKGGIVASIANELGIATRFIGLGEEVSDFETFDTERFINQIL